MAETREHFVYLAELAQSMKSYDEMLTYMHAVIKLSDGKLTAGEQELVKIAYRKAIGSRMSMKQVLSSMDDNEEGCKKALVADYVGTIESEIGDIGKTLIKLLEKDSIAAILETDELYSYSNWPEPKGPTVVLDNMNTEQLLFAAELANSIERYDTVLHYMHSVVQKSGGHITEEAKLLVTTAYTAKTRPLLAALEKLDDRLSMEEDSKELILEYMGNIEGVMLSAALKLKDILRFIIRIPVNEGMKMKKVMKDFPRYKNQGTVLGLFLSSKMYTMRAMKSLVSSNMLFRTPLKKFKGILERRGDNLQERARTELKEAFNKSFSLFSCVLSQLKVLYPIILKTQSKIKLKKRSLVFRRPLKPIFFRSTGRTCFKTSEEKRWEKFGVLIDCIECWAAQLVYHAVDGIIANSSGTTVRRRSDIRLAGSCIALGFTGSLRINANFNPEVIYDMIAEGLAHGFPMGKIKLVQTR